MTQRPDADFVVDVLIVGGGGAGLWVLRELAARGISALLVEREALGAGQTIAAQGILHGGIKYSLSGLISPSARAVRDMPELWRACLTGKREPDLRGVRILSETCLLWRAEGLAGRAGLFSAVRGLRSALEPCPPHEVPPTLEGARGEVFRLHEQVVSTSSLLETLAAPVSQRVMRGTLESVQLLPAARSPSHATEAIITIRAGGAAVENSACAAAVVRVHAQRLILAGGRGNAALRALCRLPENKMQLRPLHMVMACGRALFPLFGHCIDGVRTRATITTAWNSTGCPLWHIGGQIAEEGVAMDEATLIRHARQELAALLPALSWLKPGSGATASSPAEQPVQWAAYRVDRAEQRMTGGLRPEGPGLLIEGPVITAWPTKLVLVPELARRIMEALGPIARRPSARRSGARALVGWPEGLPRPALAAPPWEWERTWH